MLEDFYQDILEKAQTGLGISDQELLQRAGISIEDLNNARSGEFERVVAKKLAYAMDLEPEALIAIGEKQWHPKEVEVEGLLKFSSLYGLMAVNSYVIYDPITKVGALFDTGCDCGPMLKQVKELQLTIDYLFLTHTHPDHVADLYEIQKAIPGLRTVVHKKEKKIPKSGLVEGGEVYRVGQLTIKVRNTPGHSRGGVSYVVEGLSQPVIVVGDALFAGSIGGVPNGYLEALACINEQILTLPDNTVICPGHGPMSTVSEEKSGNPFFVEYEE